MSKASISPAVAVIIVNYGTWELAVKAAHSVLARAHGGRQVKVHIVDNASPGDDKHKLAHTVSQPEWQDRVVLHVLPQNIGFGRANNHVIDCSRRSLQRPKYVFLLNPDAVLINEAIETLADYLDKSPECVVAGSALINPAGAQVVSAFRFPSAQSEFARHINFGPISRLFESSQTSMAAVQPEGPVDWVSGASVMFRFDNLANLGGFNPVFFLYYEEVELMYRIHKAGGVIAHVPTAMTEHIEGVATAIKETRRKPEYWYESWRHYFSLTHGSLGALLVAVTSLLGAFIGVVIARVRLRRSHLPQHFFYDFSRLCLLPLTRSVFGHQQATD